MRVLHVAPSIARAYGGPTQSLAGYARAAQSRGCTCDVFAPTCSTDDLGSFAANAPDARVQQFPTYGRGAFVVSPALLRHLARHHHDYDVVHVHGLFNPISSLAMRLCRREGTPVVIRPHGTLSRYTLEHRRALLKQLYLTLLERPNLRAVNGVHFTTTTERDEARWHGIDLGGREFVVPPPYNVAGEAPPSSDRTTGPSVLLVSRLNPIKNIELLLDAWVEVARRSPLATLTIAGDGPASYRAALLARVATLGIEASVRFAGFVGPDQKARLFAESDIFVLPSRHENFGVAALEALAAGLPVVVSSEVQLAEFITAHRLGRVVPQSAAELSSAIVGLWLDEPARMACRATAPTLVREQFSLDRVGKALVDMYEQVSSAGPIAPPHPKS